MKQSFISMALAMACLMGAGSAQAAFKDIKVDLTNGNYLLAEEHVEKAPLAFGIAVADDGTNTRVASNDAQAAISMSGKFHSDQHGWSNFTSTVAVEGPVRISMGGCNWGGDVTVKDGAGQVVGTFTTKVGGCWSNNAPGDLLGSVVYKGSATTLTISGGAYTPYIAVEAVDPATLVEDVTITYALGDYTEAGHVLPASEKVEPGKTFQIPVGNFTLYVAGKTQTGWTDGSKNYEFGEVVEAPAQDMTLTPVFVDNTVSLADRTETVTVKWIFRKDQGAPKVQDQNKTGIWVGQVKIGTEIIDVPLAYDTNNGGKLNNSNWSDWAQVNPGTKFQIPSCKGATISYESYDATSKTTIDGQVVNTSGNKTGSFSVASPAETVEMVIGDGQYYRYIQTVLPVVEQGGSGTTFTDAEASVIWPFNNPDDYATNVTVSPDGGFSMTAFDQGVCQYKKVMSTTMCPDIKFVVLNSTNGATDLVKWCVKPAKGLTFTPVSVSFYITRDGTDGSGNDVHVQGEIPGGETVLFKDITPHRNNKTQADDNKGSLDSYTIKFDYTLTAEQQAALTSGEGFNLVMNNGYANSKGCGYSDVQIHGILNGTTVAVETFTFSAKANPAEAATISIYPNIDNYEAGSIISLNAIRNFGYQFVNWTDAAGNVLSQDAKFDYEINADSELTANLSAIETYELRYATEGGANSYQIQASPAPEIVDGKMMYEAGTKVTLNAISNPIMTFTNWGDGQSSSEISFTMDSDQDWTGVFSAADFIAGWDFYLAGNNGRPADFASADNDAATLELRDEAGNTTGWLDKSQASGGYEGRPGGVNWKTDGLGHWYWQTTLNAESFTDIQVEGAMVYNYNAYTVYKVEASTDGQNFETIGSIKMEGNKNWADYKFTLPEKFNNAPALSVRWIADKSSPVDGTSSNNDGACIGAIYFTGTPKLVNDGTAPVLVSHVPAEGATGASASGKIVLNFDEKVKMAEGVKATLGDFCLEPSVTGKTVMFAYKNLVYGQEYTFTLPAGAVMDLCDNATTEPITIKFTVRTRPEVAKALYDFVVPDDGTFKEAIAAANGRDDKAARFIIFVKKGYYELPYSETEVITNNQGVSRANPITYLNAPNTSIIGEDRDATVVTNLLEQNTPVGTAYPIEGLHNVTTLYINKGATNVYIQDITLKNGLNDACGRGEAIEDNGDRTICKNVTLWGYQDTYCSNNQNGRFYFEGGVQRGRTDYLCGKGDVYYNGVTFKQIKGGYLAVPSTPRKYGYILKDCEIVGETSARPDDNGKGEPNDYVNGNYTLGRPWGKGTPIALYIDTKMTVQPSKIGWNEMGDGWPARFAEYNSFTASGTVIDLAGRKTIFADTHENNPVLTREEAEFHSITNVLGGDDDWDPTLYTEQAPQVQNLRIEGNSLVWDDSKYASLYAVCANGNVIAFTTEPSYALSSPEAVKAESESGTDVVYSVRAANEMGGLGEAVIAGDNVAIDQIAADSVVYTQYFNLQGMRVAAGTKGFLIKVDILADGTKLTTKVMVR